MHADHIRMAIALCACLSLANAVAAQEAQMFNQNEPVSVESLVSAVLNANPRLFAAQAAIEAARYRVDTMGRLDDPMLGYGLAPLGGDQSIEISQRIPWPGTLRLRAVVAEREAEVTQWNEAAERLRLTAAAQSLYAAWYFTARALEIHHEVEARLDELIATTEARYAAGRALRQDVLQAEVERTDLEKRELELRREQTAVLANINALLNRAPDSPVPPAGTIGVRSTLPETDVLERMALEHHPELRGIETRIAGANRRVDLARKAFYPDVQFRAGYNLLWDENDKRPVLGIAINIPFDQRKRRADLNRTRAEVRQMEWTLSERQVQLRADIAEAHARVSETLESIALYQQRLVPLAEEYVEAVLADYQSGAGEFLNVITAERRLFDTEVALERARADYLMRLADLEQWTGSALYGELP